MSEQPRRLAVGRIAKAHGLRGEVVVDLYTHRTERLAPGAVLETDNDSLTVEVSREFGRRRLVWFVGIDSRSKADALSGRELFASPIVDPDEMWVHDLIGSEVEDLDGRALGVVVAVETNPASDLLVLESGHLIPCRFVTSHDPGKRIVVDIPEGLME